VNISNIDSDDDLFDSDRGQNSNDPSKHNFKILQNSKNFGKSTKEKFEPFKKKTVVDNFYPPRNKQESISIDQIDESDKEFLVHQ